MALRLGSLSGRTPPETSATDGRHCCSVGRPARPKQVSTRDPSLLDAIVADGPPLLQLTAFALFLSGCFALFLSIRREVLRQDITLLHMRPQQLCAIADCRVV